MKKRERHTYLNEWKTSTMDFYKYDKWKKSMSNLLQQRQHQLKIINNQQSTATTTKIQYIHIYRIIVAFLLERHSFFLIFERKYKSFISQEYSKFAYGERNLLRKKKSVEFDERNELWNVNCFAYEWMFSFNVGDFLLCIELSGKKLEETTLCVIMSIATVITDTYCKKRRYNWVRFILL